MSERRHVMSPDASHCMRCWEAWPCDMSVMVDGIRDLLLGKATKDQVLARLAHAGEHIPPNVQIL